MQTLVQQYSEKEIQIHERLRKKMFYELRKQGKTNSLLSKWKKKIDHMWPQFIYISSI